MSRAYRIAVTETLKRHVQADDGITAKLELLPLLSPERMAKLLADELEREGFTCDEQQAVRNEKGGIRVEIDLVKGTLRVTAEGHLDLRLEESRARVIDSDRGNPDAVEQDLKQKAQESLEQEAAREEQALRQKVTRQLEERVGELRVELEGVANKVTATALKEKAAQLGTVEQISEDPATGSVTIKVRV